MSAFLSVFVAAIAMQGGQRSLLQQVVPNPTGANGYEDYLKAADIVNDGMCSFYVNWTPNQYKDMVARMTPPPNMSELEKLDFESGKPSPQVLALVKHLDGMTVLQVRREAVQRYGKALAFLRSGNQKKVYDPREKMGVDTLFPEYASFKNLAKFATIIAANEAFADGKPHEGTMLLLDAFQLGQNLQRGVLIAHLVGIAIESITIAGFEEYMPQLPRDDAALVERTMNGYVSDGPNVVDAIRSEMKFNISSFDQILQSPQQALGLKQDDVDASAQALIKSISALSPDRKEALHAQLQAGLERSLQPVLQAFSGPESAWVAYKDPPSNTPDSESDSVKLPTNAADLVQFFIDELQPVYGGLGQAAAKNRTQMRLLGLHAAVMRYRWDNDKLPSKLEDAVPASQVDDPLSGQKFVFEPQGLWGFRIYSVGTQALGEIGLKYRRVSSGDTGGQNPPPPTR